MAMRSGSWASGTPTAVFEGHTGAADAMGAVLSRDHGTKMVRPTSGFLYECFGHVACALPMNCRTVTPTSSYCVRWSCLRLTASIPNPDLWSR